MNQYVTLWYQFLDESVCDDSRVLSTGPFACGTEVFILIYITYSYGSISYSFGFFLDSGRLFDQLTKDFLYLPGPSLCDDPGKYKKKSYNKLGYKQINVYFIFILIKKFHGLIKCKH